MRKTLIAGGLLLLVGVAFMTGAQLVEPRQSAPGLLGIAHAAEPTSATTRPTAPGNVVLTFNVGGVLTGDGTLWIYRPDLEKWLTMDEAFLEEGRETHILPLPVPVAEIRDMSTYGFLVTTTGQIWLYEHASDAWQQLPSPSR